MPDPDATARPPDPAPDPPTRDGSRVAAVEWMRRYCRRPVTGAVDGAGGEVTAADNETGEIAPGPSWDGWTDVGYTTDGGVVSVAPAGGEPVAVRWDEVFLARQVTWDAACSDPLADLREWARLYVAGETPQEPAPQRPERRARGRRSGQSAADGQTPAPPRLGTPGQATAGGVVDAITAAVEERCACGCGAALRPDGPSGYFATQKCQEKWHGTRATDPGDVYGRDDAAHYVGVDGGRWPLSEPAQVRDTPGQRARAEAQQQLRRERELRERTERFQSRWVPDESSWAELSAGDRRTLRYRRECLGCAGMRVVPRTIIDRPAEVFDFGDRGPTFRAFEPRARQVCDGCGRGFVGPVLEASVRALWHGFHLTLRVQDGTEWSVTASVDRSELLGQRDQRGFMDLVWTRMERELARQYNRNNQRAGEHVRDVQGDRLIREHMETQQRVRRLMGGPPLFPGGMVT